MGTTTPDNIFYAEAGTAASTATISAEMASSVQAALDTRKKFNYRPADAAARAAITGMRAGDEAVQQDTGVTYRYSGTAWVIAYDRTTVRTYTPVLTAASTNPALGSGSTQNGRFWYLPGKMVRVEALIRFGTSSANAGSGPYSVSLPVAADTAFHIANAGISLGGPIGNALLYDDNNTVASRGGTLQLATSTTAYVVQDTALWVTHASPWGWAANDGIGYSAFYRYA